MWEGGRVWGVVGGIFMRGNKSNLPYGLFVEISNYTLKLLCYD